MASPRPLLCCCKICNWSSSRCCFNCFSTNCVSDSRFCSCWVASSKFSACTTGLLTVCWSADPLQPRLQVHDVGTRRTCTHVLPSEHVSVVLSSFVSSAWQHSQWLVGSMESGCDHDKLNQIWRIRLIVKIIVLTWLVNRFRLAVTDAFSEAMNRFDVDALSVHDGIVNNVTDRFLKWHLFR